MYRNVDYHFVIYASPDGHGTNPQHVHCVWIIVWITLVRMDTTLIRIMCTIVYAIYASPDGHDINPHHVHYRVYYFSIYTSPDGH